TAYWVGDIHEYDGNCLRLSNKGGNYGSALTDDHIGPQIDQFFCERPDFIRITSGPANFGSKIAAFGPPKLSECTLERRHVRLLRNSHHHADAPYSLRLLRVRGNRPRYGRNATDHFDKLAPPHAAISLRLRKTHGIGSSHHRGSSTRDDMSALGQKQTCALQNVMSALHPIATAKADIGKP